MNPKYVLFIIFIILVMTMVGTLGWESIQKNREQESTDGTMSYYHMTPEPKLHVYGYEGNEKLICRLWVENGKLKYKGDMEESAQIFFEHFIKPIASGYIEEKIINQKELLRELDDFWNHRPFLSGSPGYALHQGDIDYFIDWLYGHNYVIARSIK